MVAAQERERAVGLGTIQRAAAVLRVSSAAQADPEKDSIPGQRRLAEEWCASQGWDLVAVYDETTDRGYQSGRDTMNDRPHIQRMLKDARAGAYDVVVFRDPSRLGRDDVEALILGRDLRELGVLVGFSADRRVADIQDAHDRLLFYISQWQADVDWSTILRNMASGRWAAARDGKWPGGMTPMGFDRSPDGRLVVNEGEAEILRFAFARAVAGDSIQEVTDALNRRWPRYIGKRKSIGFASSTVGRWLREPIYRGTGQVREVAPRRGAPKDRFVIPAPAIVPEETWAQANRAVNRVSGEWRKRKNIPAAGGSKLRRYPLSGGHLRHLHPSGDEVETFGFARYGERRYRCSHSVTKYVDRWEGREGFDPCPGWGEHPIQKGVTLTSVRAADVEAFLALSLARHFRSPETIAELVSEHERREAAVEDTKDVLDAAREAVAALEAEEANVRVLFIKGRLTEAQADGEFARIDAERVAAEDRVARIQAEAATLAGYAGTLGDLLDASVSLLGVGPGEPPETDVDVQTGEVVKLSPGWEDILRLIEDDARAVLAGQADDLRSETLEWVGEMARTLEVVAVVTPDGGQGGDHDGPDEGGDDQGGPHLNVRGTISWSTNGVSAAIFRRRPA